MAYTKAVNIWAIDPAKTKLTPGNWVTAGDGPGAARGKFMGVKKGGTVVVAWLNNARGWKRKPEGIAGYFKAIAAYAKA